MPEWGEHVRAALAGAPIHPAHEAEIVAELVQHLEETYRRALAEGVIEAHARARALDELSDPEALVAELTRVERARTRSLQRPREPRSGLLVGVGQEVRFACRTLLRNRAFTIVAALTLALGIGANGAIFSVVYAVLLRALPYPEPHELVMIWESRPQEGVNDNVVSPADFLDWRARQQVFDGIAAFWSSSRGVTLTDSGQPERVRGGLVSASFFGVLGVVPALGRDFTAIEEQAGRTRVVIVNDGFWRRRLGGNPGIVGQSVTLNGEPFEVIGVLPPSFRFPDDAVELWQPIDFTDEENRGRFNHFFQVFARVKPGVTIERAQGNMDLIASQLHQEVELGNQGHGAHVIALRDQLIGDVRSSLLVLMSAVAFILLIACVNVAHLLLARGALRGREAALRSALGAGRARIVRQLVIECLCLVAVAAIAAVPLALVGLEALRAFVPEEIPRLNDARLDPVVLGFMSIVALLTAVAFSLAPALQISRLDLTQALKDGGASAWSRRYLRKALVVTEVALAFVLLVGAGLLARTLVNLLNVETGFNSDNVVTVPVAPANDIAANTARAGVFYRELLDGLARQSGVAAAGFTSHLPMDGEDSRSGLGVEGGTAEPGEPVRAHWRVISPGYFDAMQIRLHSGRFPTEREAQDRAPVAVITRTTAERYWRGQNPIGRRLRLVTPEWREIIGVVDDVRHWGPSSPVNPEVYLPGFRSPTYLVVRGAQNPVALTATIRDQLQKISPDLPPSTMRTMDEIQGDAVASPRFYLVVLAAFAAVALVLAFVGVYGVIAYTVAQSQADIGIRMAIGARGRDVVHMFVNQGLALTAIGIALGAAGAFALMRLMTALLFGVTPTDTSTFVAIALLMGLVSLVACYVPAHRATRVDPTNALRFHH